MGCGEVMGQSCSFEEMQGAPLCHLLVRQTVAMKKIKVVGKSKATVSGH